ncbi:MAG: ArsC family reductase [Acidiferrobacterales bacterium]
MITVYGIKNCDTVKKACRWLDAKGLEYELHDFRIDGITKDQVTSWARTLGWEALLNRRSTTWRNLGAKEKSALTESKAISLMVKNPTLIKRPVVNIGKRYLLGFSEEIFLMKLTS